MSPGQNIVRNGLKEAASSSSKQREERSLCHCRDNNGSIQLMLYRKLKRDVTRAFSRPPTANHGSATQTSGRKGVVRKGDSLPILSETLRPGGKCRKNKESSEGGRAPRICLVSAHLQDEGKAMQAFTSGCTDSRRGRRKSRSCLRK